MPVRTSPYRSLGLFLLLSVVDLVLTAHLLLSGEGQFYETNPLARWFLVEFGWTGLTFFKLGCALLVISLSIVICRYRPRTARHVLGFGCATLALVVAYSGSLAAYVTVDSEYSEQAELRTLENHNRHLDQVLSELKGYLHLKRQLRADVLTGRLGLDEAVRELVASERSESERIQNDQPGLTKEQSVAANFVRYTVAATDETTGTSAVRRRLESDLQSLYGISSARAAARNTQ
jgi:hypothetical protein